MMHGLTLKPSREPALAVSYRQATTVEVYNRRSVEWLLVCIAKVGKVHTKTNRLTVDDLVVENKIVDQINGHVVSLNRLLDGVAGENEVKK